MEPEQPQQPVVAPVDGGQRLEQPKPAEEIKQELAPAKEKSEQAVPRVSTAKKRGRPPSGSRTNTSQPRGWRRILRYKRQELGGGSGHQYQVEIEKPRDAGRASARGGVRASGSGR